MTIQLHIVTGGELPIYRQIMRQVTDAVASGRLPTGTQLPSQRDLAEQLAISPLTVKKAYDELERDGLIETQRGRGTFVRAAARIADPRQQLERLRGGARQLVSRAHLAGVPLQGVFRLLEEIDAELRAERRKRGRQRGLEKGTSS